MASSSSSHRRNEEHDAFSGIEPQGTRRKVDESSRLFDVFINHRGPDVKQTVALQLYNSLTELGIHTFLDSEEKELGDSFPSTIENAIHSASTHIAIFSSGYAESPWCLAELLLMLQSRAKIVPVFYGVKPSDLRHIEKGEYAKAFTKYEEKKRHMEKLKEWKEALQSVSFITGHEISSNVNIRDCQNIVLAVQKEVQRTKSLHVAKYPVGLHKLVKDFERLCLDKLLEDFEMQCQMNEGGKEKAQIVGKEKAQIFGIFGMGGVGKTTLAKELFNRKRSQYRRACFLFDVREAYANNSFPSLQMKLLKDLFQEDRFNFQCTEEGKTHIADCIERSKPLSLLIVLDDIDQVQQLDDLLIMNMLKTSIDSLVIVATRHVGVLINTGITAAYNLKGMDRDDARELFCWHAFGQPHPANDYQNLVNSFLNVCGGLPLSLQVLGSHVHGTDKNYWSLELSKVSKTLPRDIHQRLKISFDALDYEEQQIFMDIACYFVGELKSIAMKVWEASGWSAQHALQTLKNKCLVQEIKEEFRVRVGEERFALRMHDHLRDLGREIANGLSRPRRLWRPQDLKYLESNGFRNILAHTKGRCFHSFIDESMNCRITYLLGESDVSADTSTFLLWLKLEYQGFQNQRQLNLDFNKLQPCIPSWIPLQNLQCLIISNLFLKTLWRSHVQPNIPSWIPLQNLAITSKLCLKTLWQSHVQAPNQLQELQIYNTSLKEFSDLSGLSNSLVKIIIDNCNCLKTMSGLSDLKKLTELNISNCLDLQELNVVHLSCLEKMVLHNCYSLKIVSGISDLRKLVELDISECPLFEQLRLVGLSNLKSITVDDSFKPACFELDDCSNLKTISGSLNLEKLVSITIRDCPKLELFPSLEGPNNLENVTIDGCVKINSLLLSRCQNLKRVMGKFDLATLFIWDCPELEALSFLQGVTFLETITIDGCGKLNSLQLFKCETLKQVRISDCPELQELSVVHLSSLEKITIQNCSQLSVSGIFDLEKPVELKISEWPEIQELTFLDFCDCLELEALPLHQGPNCLEPVKIHGCWKLNSLQFFKFQNLKRLSISDCPELKELPIFASQACLDEISIVRCGKLQNINLPTTLVELTIEGCGELNTVAVICDHSESLGLRELSSVARPSCLKRITMKTCDKLQAIQGIDELPALESLQLFDCAELEQLPCSALQTCLEKISIVRCGKLQNINLPTTLVELTIEGCRELNTVAVICDHSESLGLRELSSVVRPSCLKRITIKTCDKLQAIQGIDKLPALESLQLFDCAELEELPCSALQTCLEKISIVRCEKMQNITLPTKLVELRMEGCRELKTVEATCDHNECLELQELSNAARLSCLKQITIQTCDKLQTIQGIDELPALESMQLSYCSNAAIRNYISMLKRVPSELLVIGRAVDGALSTLNSRLFSDADGLIAEIGTRTSGKWQKIMPELSAVICCYVVGVDSCTSVHMISQFFRESNLYSWWFRVPVKAGEWVITIVLTDQDKIKSYNDHVRLQDFLERHRIIKRGYAVGLKKGEEWKTQQVLHTIIERLYDK